MAAIAEQLALAPLVREFRVRLLTYRPAEGVATLAERLLGGLSYGSPPDAAEYPYAAFRFMNVRPTPDKQDPRWQGTCELFLFFRPRSAREALEEAADVAVAALNTWRDVVTGVHRVSLTDRDTMPAFSEKADPEVIQARLVSDLLFFPVPT
jgi:hypothetical protein